MVKKEILCIPWQLVLSALARVLFSSFSFFVGLFYLFIFIVIVIIPFQLLLAHTQSFVPAYSNIQIVNVNLIVKRNPMYTVKIQMHNCRTFATQDDIGRNMFCKMKNVASFFEKNWTGIS